MLPTLRTRLLDACGDIDLPVNNAGAIPAGDIDDDRWRAAWDLKVHGYINMTRVSLPRLHGRGVRLAMPFGCKC